MTHSFPTIHSEGLSTALVFKALNLDSCSSIESLSLLEGFQSQGALEAAGSGLLINDLEPPAFHAVQHYVPLEKRLQLRWIQPVV